MTKNNDQTVIQLYASAQGPFANNDIRIKVKFNN